MKRSKIDVEMQIKDALKSYKDAGLTYYEYFAGLDIDNNTCDKCASLNRKIFRISEAKIGVNAPPMHDGCRCNVLAVIEEDDDEDETFTNTCEDCGNEFITYNKSVTVCKICKQKRRDKYNRLKGYFMRWLYEIQSL